MVGGDGDSMLMYWLGEFLRSGGDRFGGGEFQCHGAGLVRRFSGGSQCHRAGMVRNLNATTPVW